MKDLLSKSVIVHPHLTSDPADRQGHLGTISHVSYDNEVIEVSFADGQKSLYATDALLVLKTHSELFRELMTHVQQTDPQDFKTLLRISMILENGTPRQQHEALGMALVNEKVLRFATTSLASRLELTLPEDMHPHWKKGSGR
jgi:hypothetical protein